jgi:hypothetical protein
MSETILAAMIGAGATMAAAIFNLFMAFRARTKAESKPRRGGTARSLFSVFAIVLASAVGGFAYSELRAERIREDTRELRVELTEQREALLNAQRQAVASIDAQFDRLRAAQAGTGGTTDAALMLAAARQNGDGAAESLVRVGTCRPRPATGAAAAAACTADDSEQIALCASVPAQASVRAVELFARPADVEQPWEQSRVAFDQDAGGAHFSGTPVESPPNANSKTVCVNFSHWNGERGFAARMLVLYSAEAERKAPELDPKAAQAVALSPP